MDTATVLDKEFRKGLMILEDPASENYLLVFYFSATLFTVFCF